MKSRTPFTNSSPDTEINRLRTDDAWQHARRGAVDDTDARQQLRAAERDMRYYSAQLERAELVTPASAPVATPLPMGV